MTFSQTRVSIATDLSVQRSFKKDQRFWALGQDIVIDWHFTPKGGAYGSICYYSNGKFDNPLTAPAKSPSTLPQQIFFTNYAKLRLEQISIGWKHYFVGTSDAEKQWNLYGLSGFGLIFGKVVNAYSVAVDTSLYDAPAQPINGKGHFKRLTFDLGLGWEIPLAGEVYLYSEGRVWIPTTEYPSKYLFANNNAPFAAMVTGGLRVLF
jgi:hypothetical protein